MIFNLITYLCILLFQNFKNYYINFILIINNYYKNKHYYKYLYLFKCLIRKIFISIIDLAKKKMLKWLRS